MAYKALIFGTDGLYSKLKPLYEAEVKRGNLEIVAYAVLEKDRINLVDDTGRPEDWVNFDLAIISSRSRFYKKMKMLEANGFSRDRIIDGRAFLIPNLDFPRLVKEGVAYAVLEKNTCSANSRTIYPQVYNSENNKATISLGTKSYIVGSRIDGAGLISLGKFCSFAHAVLFNIGLNRSHNYLNVGMSPSTALDWGFPKEFFPPQGACKILIGNDVWVGRGCILKCSNPNKPLVIGDGAVIASDSVVVKNVPPYAIVGGNPAQIIKYRFPPHIIEALLRIKWWDWSLDKIHDNFEYWNNIEKFISLHDK